MKNIAGNSFLKKNKDKIFVDSMLINDILNLAETPIMVFLENRIRENIRTFTQVFGSTFKGFQGYYSFKANYLPEICSIIGDEGLGAELIGLPELNLALKLGFPAKKIILGGPYLPTNLIDRCIKEQINELIVYNVSDLRRIDKLAGKYGITQNICLRIKSKKYAAKLGISDNSITMKKLKELLKNCKNIRLATILSHYTTQMNNFEQYRDNLMTIIHFYRKLRDYDIRIDNLNLGGGFPEACIMQKPQLQLIANKIKASLQEFDINYKSIYFEPGRYIVGDSSFFIARIINKTSDRWIYLDIGNHICPKFAKCSLRFYNIDRIMNPHKFKTSIAGIIPTDQDVLAKDYFFTKELVKGDKVMVLNVGAYCLTFSNRFPYNLPQIFLINGDTITLIFDHNIQRDISLT